MTIHEPGVKGGEEISDPVTALCVNVIVLGMILMMRVFLPPCAENEFGGDVVSRSSLAERQKVTLEAEVGANELCHAHNASGTARLQDHCHSCWFSS